MTVGVVSLLDWTRDTSAAAGISNTPALRIFSMQLTFRAARARIE